MPEQTTSPGFAFSERQRLETEYFGEVDPEIRSYVLWGLALLLKDDFSNLAVFSEWRRLTDSIAEKGTSARLASEISNSAIPDRMIEAGREAKNLAGQAGLVGAELGTFFRKALGLVPNADSADDKYGSFHSSEGSFSWKGAGRGAARTAATADHGREMIDLAREEGYSHKRWSTRNDSLVRDSHRNADRQTVNLDQEFAVGATSLRYPADEMSNDLGEVINCRCVLILVRFGDRALDYPEGAEPWNDPYPGRIA